MNNQNTFTIPKVTPIMIANQMKMWNSKSRRQKHAFLENTIFSHIRDLPTMWPQRMYRNTCYFQEGIMGSNLLQLEEKYTPLEVFISTVQCLSKKKLMREIFDGLISTSLTPEEDIQIFKNLLKTQSHGFVRNMSMRQKIANTQTTLKNLTSLSPQKISSESTLIIPAGVTFVINGSFNFPILSPAQKGYNLTPQIQEKSGVISGSMDLLTPEKVNGSLNNSKKRKSSWSLEEEMEKCGTHINPRE